MQFRKKDYQERKASGISPEQTQLDILLEEINAREEASEILAAEVGAKEKRQLEENKVAAEEIRRRALEKFHETKKRNENDEGGPKPKVRKGGYSALGFLAGKEEKERGLKEEINRLERERLVMEK